MTYSTCACIVIVSIVLSPMCSYDVVARNVALTGIATASSSDKNTKPQWAIDGNMANSLSQHSCSLTKIESDPFWKATFKKLFRVYEVVLETSVNCCCKYENEVLFPSSGSYSHNLTKTHETNSKLFALEPLVMYVMYM